MTSAVSAAPDFKKLSATDSANTKPAHTAWISKAAPPVRAELSLNLGRRCGEGIVRRRGGDDDQIDVGGRDAGSLERPERRLPREIRGELALRRDVTLPDAGALDDPRIGSVDRLGQLLVRNDPLGQIASPADDPRPQHIQATDFAWDG